jgi:hypothetical protein
MTSFYSPPHSSRKELAHFHIVLFHIYKPGRVTTLFLISTIAITLYKQTHSKTLSNYQ